MSETNQQLTQEFYAHFRARRSELLARFDVLSGGGSPDVLEQLSLDVAKLRKELTDATSFLPSYDRRQCEIQMKATEESLQTLRTASAPKSKFAFKRKANHLAAVARPSAPAQDIRTTSEPASSLDSASTSTSLSLSGHSHQFLTWSSLPASPASSTSDLTISDLDHCIVYLLPSDSSHGGEPQLRFTALHVRNISDSVLILPRMDGSALLHDMSRCVVALGCRQYRMHTSTQTDVYIAVSSNPIIEHCTGIRFAGYPPFSHTTQDSHTQVMPTSNHLAVQDFSHIRPTPSPNWSVLPEDELLAEPDWPTPWDFERVGVDETLHKVIPTS